jgi:hypothetical protein
MRSVLIETGRFQFSASIIPIRNRIFSGIWCNNMPIPGGTTVKSKEAFEMLFTTNNLFEGKSETARDIYSHLLGELSKVGPIREIPKEISVNLENRKHFASAIVRNRSIKLVLRTNHKIASPRILNVEQVAKKSYDHTILLESKRDIDDELIHWLGDAYQTSK